MSKNTDPTRGCDGKAKYWTFARAERAAKKSAKALEEPMHAYKCVHCNRFHVGGHNRVLRPKPPVDPIRIEDDAGA